MFGNGVAMPIRAFANIHKLNFQQYYPLSKQYHSDYLKRINQPTNQNYDNDDNTDKNSNIQPQYNKKPQYPLSRKYYEDYIKRLNSKNITIQNDSILDAVTNDYENKNETDNNFNIFDHLLKNNNRSTSRSIFFDPLSGITIEFEGRPLNPDDDPTDGEFEEDDETGRRTYVERKNSKSKNFEVIKNFNIKFKDIGGYDIVKQELFNALIFYEIIKNT
jgi:hypothetical protein